MPQCSWGSHLGRMESMAGCVGTIKQRVATKPDFDSRVVCGNEKSGAWWFVRHGFFVGAHDRQRWRDGEDAFDSCLHRDVAAINKMHFCTQQTGTADQAAKSEGGVESSAPFCCPSTKAMDVDFDLCGGIYPIRAQDISAYYATGRRVRLQTAAPAGRDWCQAERRHRPHPDHDRCAVGMSCVMYNSTNSTRHASPRCAPIGLLIRR